MMIHSSNDNFRVNDDEVQKNFKLNRLIAIYTSLLSAQAYGNIH